MRVSSMSRVKTRPGLEASAARISNSTNVVSAVWPSHGGGALGGVDAQLAHLDQRLAALVHARHAGAPQRRLHPRERNSRIENSLVM